MIPLLLLAFRSLQRRPLRTLFTVLGLALSVAVHTSLLAFGQNYERGLRQELDGMGMQLMIVPLGCPYDAAVHVLKGKALDANITLPHSALDAVRADDLVAVAAPLFMTAVIHPSEKRTDMWVGIDAETRRMKPWWTLTKGSHWLSGPRTVLLGAEAAEVELRVPGDKFYSPGTNKELTVSGVLERTGTSDDSLFFVGLETAQEMAGRKSRLTAIAVRLKDPAEASRAAARFQKIPGAQVVTLTEMRGTFLNLLLSARTVVLAVALVAVGASALGVFNTMTASVLERTGEMAMLRALGASKGDTFLLMGLESVMLALFGGALGLTLAALSGSVVMHLTAPLLPLTPSPPGGPSLTFASALDGLVLVVFIGVLAGLHPAWRASRVSPSAALRKAV